MCTRHWFMVPVLIRYRVLSHYRRGQEIDKRPSAAWHDAADAAIEAVWWSELADKAERGFKAGEVPLESYAATVLGAHHAREHRVPLESCKTKPCEPFNRIALAEQQRSLP